MKKRLFALTPLIMFTPFSLIACAQNDPSQQATSFINKKDIEGNYINIKLNEENETFTLDLSKENIKIINSNSFLDGQKTRVFFKNQVIKDDKGNDYTITKKYYLTKIIFPSSLEKIEESAFRNTTLLEEKFQIQELDFSLATSLKEIGDSAFEGNNIISLTLPDSLERISNLAFANNNISELNISENSNLRNIGISAFFNNKIENLNFKSDKIKFIAKSSFEKNVINSLNFNEKVTGLTIEKSAFKNNSISNSNVEEISKNETNKINENYK